MIILTSSLYTLHGQNYILATFCAHHNLKKQYL